MENYFNDIMKEGFELLSSSRVSWPTDLDNQQKISLLTKHLEYFDELEQYEKCAVLKKKITRLSKIKKAS
jgi:protein-arginine kinase activator protein McsA